MNFNTHVFDKDSHVIRSSNLVLIDHECGLQFVGYQLYFLSTTGERDCKLMNKNHQLGVFLLLLEWNPLRTTFWKKMESEINPCRKTWLSHLHPFHRIKTPLLFSEKSLRRVKRLLSKNWCQIPSSPYSIEVFWDLFLVFHRVALKWVPYSNLDSPGLT